MNVKKALDICFCQKHWILRRSFYWIHNMKVFWNTLGPFVGLLACLFVSLLLCVCLCVFSNFFPITIRRNSLILSLKLGYDPEKFASFFENDHVILILSLKGRWIGPKWSFQVLWKINFCSLTFLYLTH